MATNTYFLITDAERRQHPVSPVPFAFSLTFPNTSAADVYPLRKLDPTEWVESLRVVGPALGASVTVTPVWQTDAFAGNTALSGASTANTAAALSQTIQDLPNTTNVRYLALSIAGAQTTNGSAGAYTVSGYINRSPVVTLPT